VKATLDFEKYHSLGNDFILFDQEISPHPEWVQKLCHRHYGIGADGVIFIKNQKEMRIFNADGSEAEMCLNGVRCTALYLATKYGVSTQAISIGNRQILCTVTGRQVTSFAGSIDSYRSHTVSVQGSIYNGYFVSIGNPHFLVFKTTTCEWLAQNGKFFEQHASFPNRTNVEFVTKEETGKYRVVVFERGVGLSLACGSAAAALVGLLFEKKELSEGEIISVTMPGGSLTAYVQGGEIAIEAEASSVFSGKVQSC
jgi:diaminopimelate epimerase